MCCFVIDGSALKGSSRRRLGHVSAVVVIAMICGPAMRELQRSGGMTNFSPTVCKRLSEYSLLLLLPRSAVVCPVKGQMCTYLVLSSLVLLKRRTAMLYNVTARLTVSTLVQRACWQKFIFRIVYHQCSPNDSLWRLKCAHIFMDAWA